MMPRVYGRLMPDSLNLVFTNNCDVKPIINVSLLNYLSLATKATEQYSEIWDTMIKITNMYENLGDKPKFYYEIREILDVFKLSINNTETIVQCDKQLIKTVLERIYNCKKGANKIIKISHIFSQVEIDIIYILSLCFNEVYIYNPASSSVFLSEKYVVCKDFKLTSTTYLNNIFRQILCEVKIAIEQNAECVSLYNRKINNNYMNTLIEANSVIGQQQLEAINNTITLIEQGKKNEKIEALKKQQALKCAEWNKKFGVRFNNHSDKDELESI
jgi:hypothetical protein